MVGPASESAACRQGSHESETAGPRRSRPCRRGGLAAGDRSADVPQRPRTAVGCGGTPSHRGRIIERRRRDSRGNPVAAAIWRDPVARTLLSGRAINRPRARLSFPPGGAQRRGDRRRRDPARQGGRAIATRPRDSAAPDRVAANCASADALDLQRVGDRLFAVLLVGVTEADRKHDRSGGRRAPAGAKPEHGARSNRAVGGSRVGR